MPGLQLPQGRLDSTQQGSVPASAGLLQGCLGGAVALEDVMHQHRMLVCIMGHVGMLQRCTLAQCLVLRDT
jgi:hypothetical protein